MLTLSLLVSRGLVLVIFKCLQDNLLNENFVVCKKIATSIKKKGSKVKVRGCAHTIRHIPLP